MNDVIFCIDYPIFYSDITKIEAMLTNSTEIEKRCTSCLLFLSDFVHNILFVSQYIEIDTLVSMLYRTLSNFKQFYLPFYLGDLNISYSDFQQYSVELTKDINSFLKSNLSDWKLHMKLENNATKACVPVAAVSIAISCIPFVGFIGTGICYSFLLYKKIQQIRRDRLRYSLNPTIFPFLWKKDLISKKCKNYDLIKLPLIGNKKDKLIVFYDQNCNDSSKIFRSLTGFDVDYSAQNQVSDLFLNIQANSLMKRYRRYGKIHTSRLDSQNIHILYLKGHSQEVITAICQSQNNPIFISSLIENQSLTIKPADDCLLNLFYISPNYYDSKVVNIKEYILIMNSVKVKSLKKSLNLNNADILIVHSKDYNFDEYGPIANALVKYGCRFALQDTSFYNRKDWL